jgi:uncharacterized protein DUF4864
VSIDRSLDSRKFWLSGMFLACFLISALYGDSAPADLHPDPKLSPQQVVEFQLTALRGNDVPTADAGIERSFRFASPANKAATGPLEHFTVMVHGSQYSSLINAVEGSVTKVVTQDNIAQVLTRIVTADGSEVYYVFILSKQAEGDYVNCWMTDGVVPLKEAGEATPGTAI